MDFGGNPGWLEAQLMKLASKPRPHKTIAKVEARRTSSATKIPSSGLLSLAKGQSEAPQRH